jgi:Family of unknown function (DUF6152)
MSRPIFGVCLAALVWLFASPALAHHSFGAEFDANKPITLMGVVKKVEWTNPHSHFSLEVKDEKGRTVTWQLTGYTVNALYRTGWKKDVTMKVGDAVTIFGWRARDGSNSAHAREVTFADGKKLFYGPPAGTGEGGPTPAVKVP